MEYYLILYALGVCSFLTMTYYYHKKITKLYLFMSLFVGFLGPVAIVGSFVAILADSFL